MVPYTHTHVRTAHARTHTHRECSFYGLLVSCVVRLDSSEVHNWITSVFPTLSVLVRLFVILHWTPPTDKSEPYPLGYPMPSTVGHYHLTNQYFVPLVYVSLLYILVLHCIWCMSILKVPEWLGISDMSSVLHTLANWELSFQPFSSIQLQHHHQGMRNAWHTRCMSSCVHVHTHVCVCANSFLLAHYIQYISSILAGLRVCVWSVCYASHVPGNQLPIVGDKTCSVCIVMSVSGWRRGYGHRVSCVHCRRLPRCMSYNTTDSLPYWLQ